MEPPSQQQKSLKCSTWLQPQKWQNDLSSFPRQAIQHHNNPSLSLCYHQWGRSWNWSVLGRPRFPRINTLKDVLFTIGDWKAKAGSQGIPAVTGKFGLGLQNEAGQRLADFCQQNALVIANALFQQCKRLYIWTSSNGQYWNQICYTLCSQIWRSCIKSGKMRPGADCGSDHQLLTAKFRLKLKNAGKKTLV